MSTDDEHPVRPGVGGWFGHIADASPLRRDSTPRAFAQPSPPDDRADDPRDPGRALPAHLNHVLLAPFSRNVFPLPLPDDTDVTFMMIFGIMAIGLNIVAGFAGLLDLGYVAFYALGAYTAAFFASPHFGSVSIVLFSNVASRVPGHPPAVLDHPAGGGRSSPRRSVRCSARRPCACAATTWPS